MKPDYEIIGARIKNARLSKQLTQQELSEQMEISIPFLSKVERGTSHFNLERIFEVCSILEVSESYLLAGVSKGSEFYLEKEFSELLKDSSAEDKKLIYEIAKLMKSKKKSE